MNLFFYESLQITLSLVPCYSKEKHYFYKTVTCHLKSVGLFLLDLLEGYS